MRVRGIILASFLFAVGRLGLSYPSDGSYVDAAPFGRALLEKNSVGVQWSEPRRIQRVEVRFEDDGSPLSSVHEMQIQYWHRVWNGSSVRRYGFLDAGSVGWVDNDDWFNGEWKTADSRIRLDGRTAVFTFAPSNEKEFPGLTSAGVTYRPTLKVRLTFAGAHPRIEQFRAMTDSIWQSSEPLRIQFQGRTDCDDPIEVYNGILALNSIRTVQRENVCELSAEVKYAHNHEDNDVDRTLVTVRSPKNPFTFAVDEVVSGNRIFVPDFGVLVTRGSDPVTIAEHRQALLEMGEKSVFDRIQTHEEQSLANAWNDMPLKRPYYMVLGLEGSRHRFALDAAGDIWTNHPTFSKKRPGKDNDRLLWPDGIVYKFGLPEGPFADQALAESNRVARSSELGLSEVQFANRTLAEGYLPIVTTRWLDGDLIYEQEAFAQLLNGDLKPVNSLRADDTTVALLRFRFVNGSSQAKTARLAFTSAARASYRSPEKEVEALRLDGDSVLGTFNNQKVLRFLVDIRSAGHLMQVGEGVHYDVELRPFQEHSVYVKVPFITLVEREEIDHLRALDYEVSREQVVRYWKERVAAGSKILTPEPWLNDFYKAHLVHMLINDEREVGADRYAARVGSFFYGAYANESMMMISDFDRRGYAKEAERSLELFLHYQGTVPLPGKFTSSEGVFNGAGGYEMGDYNQHHGWTLWALGEHYWYTRDRRWMEHAAPHILQACDWIIEQRKTTMKKDANGHPVREYGLLPAGSLEDVQDFWYWLSTNVLSWWGLDNTARALQDFGHPRGPNLMEDAESYRNDILQAFNESSIRSPVVQLRDGTYVPHIPSEVYTRGRSHGWIRETLEGSIMLPITRLFDPASRQTEWILKDYEDNRYISDRFGYPLPLFDRFWFSRGGFSFQPNLLHGPLPYFYRDQIKHFLRAYFNGFASSYDPTLRMLSEHPLPELGYIRGDHYKTSDEAQSTYWLRLMYVAEIEGKLFLGRGLPRYWLEDGNHLAIKNAVTYFGPMSYEIRSNSVAGRISMTLDPPARNAPREIIVRFRHPQAKPIRSVTVNGEPWKNFDPVKGDIQLPGGLSTRSEIVARY